MKHNLLTEPIFSAVIEGAPPERLTLPGLLNRLCRDTPLTFPSLRPHQAPAWHAFLVQLAVLAMEAASRAADDWPEGEEGWRQTLRTLTSDHPDDAPWCLISPPDRPALLQAPAPDFLPNTFKTRLSTPDEIDLLVTSKNHDVKAARMLDAEPQDWVFALVSIQTQEGQMGRGNYGVARMNGGYGSRTYLNIDSGGGLSGLFQREVGILLRNTNRLRTESPFSGTLGLIWLRQWDGKRQLPVEELHPLCIEICRRIRLVEERGAIVATIGNSDNSRIAARDLNGVVGDPWMPVSNSGEPKALSITADGFSWRQMKQLLFGEGDRAWRLPLLAKPRRDDDSPVLALNARAIARGQGKTEGFHERRVIIPPHVRAMFEDAADEERKLWAEAAENHARDAADIANKVLKPALFMAFSGGPDSVNFGDRDAARAANIFLQEFDSEVDRTFFPALWGALDQSIGQRRHAWRRQLRRSAQRTFYKALSAGPRGEERRFRAEARARALFNGALYKNFDDLRQEFPAMEADHGADA